MDLDHLQALLGDMAEPEAPDTLDSQRDLWAVAEFVGSQPTALTAQLLGKARELASELGAYVRVAALGSNLAGCADRLIALGADGVHLADHPALGDLAAEPVMAVLSYLFEQYNPSAVLFPAGTLGDAIAPRLAQRLGATLTTRCVALRPDLATRAIAADLAVYEGEFYESRSLVADRENLADQLIQMFSVLPNAFPTPQPDPYRSGSTEGVDIDLDATMSRVRSHGPADYYRPAPPIERARRLVALGHELGEENLAAAQALAARIGAQLAGDRTAVAAGWIDHNQVVGVTGRLVRPDLYLALGVRGGTEHNYGLENARYIVAIHPDPNAPIFQVADLCLVAEPGEILAQL